MVIMLYIELCPEEEKAKRDEEKRKKKEAEKKEKALEEEEKERATAEAWKTLEAAANPEPNKRRRLSTKAPERPSS